MTPAGRNERPPAPQRPGPRPNGVLRQAAWASVPIWSIGFLSFVPFLAYAVIQRRKRDWALFARRGLWGTVDERFNIRLFPVGYHLWAPGETRRRRRAAVDAAS